MTEYTTVCTALGVIALARSQSGLVAVTLPHDREDAAVEKLLSALARVHDTPARVASDDFGSLATWLSEYASGERRSFPVKLDTRGWTDFQSRIWHATLLIPYGETRSYSWVACEAGSSRACRAAGQALHRNPFPIVVPCHRVVGADGSLTGFGGGLEMKRTLLALEGHEHC